MKNLRPSEDTVIELGKKILEQFAKIEDRTILTSWMSHYVASLITEVESQAGTASEAKAKQTCSDAILKLWAHRNSLPEGARPFEGVERAAKLLERISPDSHHRFYFEDPLPTALDQNEVKGSEIDWLKVAEDFDSQASKFIQLCLGESISGSNKELREWLKLIEGISADDDLDVTLVRKALNLSGTYTGEDPKEEPTKLTGALSKLDGIIERLVEVRNALKSETIR